MPKHWCLFPLILLAACDPAVREPDAPQGNAEATPEPVADPTALPETADPSPVPDAELIANETVAAPESPPPPVRRPTPGRLQAFGDWTVGCDNLRQCTALALGPEEGPPPALVVAVTNGPAAGSLGVEILGFERVAPPATVVVDDTPVVRGGTASDQGVRFTGDEARKLVRAMAEGREATISADGRSAPLSLTGVSAALRHADQLQGRAGTDDALVAVGERRYDPAPVTPPRVRALRAAGTPARPSEQQVTQMRRAADCQVEFLPAETIGPQGYALGGGTTLVLLPCGAGAYNFLSAAFVIAGDGVARPARFDAPVGIEDERVTVAQLVNARFASGVLASDAKGRGLGDCGIRQHFVWDGARFRLVEQTELDPCRGATRFLRTWRAEVERTPAP